MPGAVYRPHIDGAWPGSCVDAQGNYVYDAYNDGRCVWGGVGVGVVADEFANIFKHSPEHIHPLAPPWWQVAQTLIHP